MYKYKNMGSVSLNVDIDIDDILWNMNNHEKNKLFDTLKEDLGIDNIIEGDPVIGTPTETELFDICMKIYDNRNSLTNEDKSLLIKLSKKGWYDKVV